MKSVNESNLFRVVLFSCAMHVHQLGGISWLSRESRAIHCEDTCTSLYQTKIELKQRTCA
jgi:hypothetical protein